MFFNRTSAQKNLLFPAFLRFVPCAVVLTVAIAFGHIAAQQVLRQGANDPQIQTAEDVADVLSQGQTPAFFDQNVQPVAIEKSLAPYVIVYSDIGVPLQYTGVLHGAPPKVPQGVLLDAKMSGENRVTWQPEPGVRQAIVIVPFHHQNDSGFVVAGRSLREVERREDALVRLTVLAWLVGIFLTALACVCCELVPMLSSSRK